MPKNKLKLTALLIAALLIAGAVFWFLNKDETASETAQNNTASPNGEQANRSSFDKSRYSLEDPASLWVVVNKQRPLQATYVPSDPTNVNGASLRKEAAEAARQLIENAAADSVRFKAISGYRSYQSQKTVYDGYVRQHGEGNADTFSARPGHSEHQTGWAIDIVNSDGRCDLVLCFAETPGGKWLVDNAHEYGFIIRYEMGKTPVTGYEYEPWHLRYVGKDLAAELKKTGLTMEEFFDLPAAPTYPF